MRVGREARDARTALAIVRERLGPRFGFPG
jgi:hypothetical protein